MLSIDDKTWNECALVLTEAQAKIEAQKEIIAKLEKEVEYFKAYFEKYVDKWAAAVERDVIRFYQNVD